MTLLFFQITCEKMSPMEDKMLKSVPSLTLFTTDSVLRSLTIRIEENTELTET